MALSFPNISGNDQIDESGPQAPRQRGGKIAGNHLKQSHCIDTTLACTTHRALEVLEIVELICAQIGSEDLEPLSKTASHDLAVLARTCTIFQNPALNMLWRTQVSILNLMRCMPDDLWEQNLVGVRVPDMRLLRPIMPSDWQRPLFYSKRVRSLESAVLDDSAHLGSSDIFDTLGLCLPGQFLFPNLQRLNWNVLTPFTFHSIRFFLAPTITRIVVDVSSTSQLSLLPTLPVKCPYLTHITVSTAFGLSGVLQSISEFVCGLPHIESLDLENLDPATLEYISQLQTLTSLILSGAKGFETFINPMTSPKYAFSALKTLEFRHCTVECATAFIEMMFEATLQSFSLENPDPQVTDEATAQLYAAIAGCCSHSLRFLLIDSYDPVPAAQIAAYTVRSQTLQRLFCLSNLVTIFLRCAVGFDLDDNTISDMARSWPCVERIVLAAIAPHHIPSRVTLDGIYAFAQHCPRLQDLEITFDASVVPKIDKKRVSQEQLLSLDVAASAIRTPKRVAKFVSYIFPKLRRIGTAYDEMIWGEDEDEIQVDDAVKESHELWKDVEELLQPEFQDD
ncbi:hypothetical protein B0H10DRAFT_525549 [Mycena sp. CBHHK59/15]|nr:hypothetical protein B0H10DRAFT_525549 [Mycena sp. CBHHK59/15]